VSEGKTYTKKDITSKKNKASYPVLHHEKEGALKDDGRSHRGRKRRYHGAHVAQTKKNCQDRGAKKSVKEEKTRLYTVTEE